jgi:uncharacterized protein YdeI (YjbR/CyaY-like superfamily)
VPAKPFLATLERMPGRLSWTIIRVPEKIAKLWGKRGQLRAKVEINGTLFRTSLFPDGRGGHYMLVNKQMQRAAGVRAGQIAEFLLRPDSSERKGEMPAEFARLLREEKQLVKFYSSLNPSMQRDIMRFVAGPKSVAARQRRAEQLAVRMLETLEAERELPPMLKLAMARTPGAAAGWRNMTARMRRLELMGIFYYRDPESRGRRIEKAIELMLTYSGRKTDPVLKKRETENQRRLSLSQTALPSSCTAR